MAIRDATPADADAIHRVHEASIRELGPAAYDAEQVEAWAAGCDSADYGGSIASASDDDAAAYVVAERDGAVRGFGSLFDAPDRYPDRVDAEITGIYVDPAVARQGVGTVILDELQSRAARRGVDAIGLTASRNAVSFYRHHGYDPRQSFEHEFSAHESTGVTGTVVEMIKPLADDAGPD